MRTWRFGLACAFVFAGLSLFVACGSESEDPETSTDGSGGDSGDKTTLTWSKDIKPIVEEHCAISGGCHDGDPIAIRDYTGSSGESVFKDSPVKTRINDGTMPSGNGTAGWTDAKKDKIFDFLSQ